MSAPPKLRTAFMGTPEIAVPAFEQLAKQTDVRAVICQPDRPKGRGMKLAAPAIKVRALELGLEVMQPTKIRTQEFADWFRSLQLDAALVMAYGRILPSAILSAPRKGCLNLHASLLPKLRGAAPIQWAIVRGETETGISLMQMDEGCDTGPVFTKNAIPIEPTDTAGSLAEKIAALGARVVEQDFERAVSGAIQAAPQPGGATEAPLLSKEDGAIDWSRSAQDIDRLVRGLSPWPSAFTRVDGKTLKVLEGRAELAGETVASAGEVVLADKDRIEVACGSGVFALVRAQLEGRKALGARDLVAGRSLKRGQKLGEA